MPVLPVLRGRQVVQVFEAFGWRICWRAPNIDQVRALNIDQAFYCVANYATVDKSTRL